jgi:hypothetical protein
MMKNYFTRFAIFLWCGIGFLLVSLRHILINGYNHRAGFMMLLGLALLAAAITDRKRRQIKAWMEEETRRKLEEERQKKNPQGGK